MGTGSWGWHPRSSLTGLYHAAAAAAGLTTFPALPAGLLSVQLAVTAAVAAAFVVSAPLQLYVAANPWTMWATLAVSFVLVLVMACSETARRTHPWNLLCLFAFTGCEAVLMGILSASLQTDVLLMAAGITLGATVVLSLYALQTKHDFTAAGGVLFSLLWALIAAGLLSFFFHSRIMNILVSALGAAVFSCYIVFDVLLMVGGGRYSISPDDYVMAALNIYLDVINLFLYLVQLLNEINGNSN
jgi:FtsH-binding integral membrane protein